MGLIKRSNGWINRHLVTLLKIWVVLFTLIVIVLLVQGRNRDSKIEVQAQNNRELIVQLKENQKAIQRSRIQSCIASYNTILHAFDPFIPKADDPTTHRNEVQDFKTFRNGLIKKRNRCKTQVAVKKGEK